MASASISSCILDAPGFHKLRDEVTGIVDDWFAAWRPRLVEIDADTKPADLVTAMSEHFLERFKPVPLLDEYDAYQQLMTYWHDVMHDDVFLIMNDGWVDAAKPRQTIEDKERKLSEDPDLELGTGRKKTKYKMDLIPPALIVARYFADERARVDELNADLESATAVLTEHAKEHGADEALLTDATNDKGAYTKQLITAVIKEAKASGDQDSLECAKAALDLVNAEAAAKKAAKEAQVELDTATLKKYGDLTEADVQTLVLDDKWHATIAKRIDGEVNALTLVLVARIQQLGERYAATVGDLDTELESLEAKVTQHLADMGVES